LLVALKRENILLNNPIAVEKKERRCSHKKGKKKGKSSHHASLGASVGTTVRRVFWGEKKTLEDPGEPNPSFRGEKGKIKREGLSLIPIPKR